LAVTFSFTASPLAADARGEHIDGWDIAFHDENGCRVFIDDKRAGDSPLTEFLISARATDGNELALKSAVTIP
jgi:predicted glutamine amidotransferase